MPSTLSRAEIAHLVVTREQAAHIANLNPTSIDRLRADGRIEAITDHNGRLIAFFREDIVALIGGGYRRKPGNKTRKPQKPEPRNGAGLISRRPNE
jgi:hypothetical protein